MAEMSTRIERTWTGAFRATHLGKDSWQLTMGVAGSPEIYLSGVDRNALAGAIITLNSSGASTQFRSRTATVHEPRPQLYQGLPLVVLDDAARRFWRRVFLIARLPGGRRLLRWIAQRTRTG
jgi:hypothetical protein